MKLSLRPSSALFVIALCAALSVTSCSTSTAPQDNGRGKTPSSSGSSSEPNIYRFPTGVAGPYNVVWSASDQIDLHSRAAELARAYVESCQLSIFGRQAAYPGAVAAAPAPTVDHRMSCLFAPEQPEGDKPAYFGTLHATILELDSSQHQVSARGCYTTNGRADVKTQEPESDYLNATEFSFVAQLPGGKTDPRAGVGRGVVAGATARAPHFDVFYPWKFEAVRRGTPAPPEPPFNERPCTRWAARMLDQIPAYSGQNPFAPDGSPAELELMLLGERGFPTLPQSPAWPES